ncbi:MAG: DUF805 domain-containing protein [Novosphingobium sp.]|nr:DUF805 domain-containing protein [Novosphingobium sp.]
MFSHMFGSFSQGTIGRLRFVLLTLLLGVIFAAVGMSLGVGAALFDRSGTDLSAAPAMGATGLIVFALAGLALFVGMLNLVAKRARDIGWSALLLVVFFLIFWPLVWVVLALFPGKQAAA